MAASAGLLGADERLICLQRDGLPQAPGIKVQQVAAAVQMVYGGQWSQRVNAPIEVLDPAAAAEMRALVGLTKPGPFRERTHELGRFLGIRAEGKLVAIAGERMKLAGYTEVSAVCTHPDHRGRGYAAALTLNVAEEIARRGEAAFLHVYASNDPAISLYRSIGFTIRAEMTVTVIGAA
jgi:predicted GNAT family acetyltransferase